MTNEKWIIFRPVNTIEQPSVSEINYIQYMLIGTVADLVFVFTGESIPIRLFLSPYELTPTHRNINNKFSVKYFLNLVLVDEEDRRYFKQQEITMYRLQEENS